MPAGHARQNEKLDADVAALLTEWFDDGETSHKTKCSAAAAVARLRALSANGENVHVNEDTVPSETRVKRFFSSLAQKRHVQAST